MIAVFEQPHSACFQQVKERGERSFIAGELNVVVVRAGFSARMFGADHKNMCEQNNSGGVVSTVIA